MTKVLIVEDNASIVKVTRIVLEREGCQVMSADDEQCFVIAEEWDPSIILMDIRLPRLDGIEACMRLKMNPITAHIPVIMVTADKEAVDVVEEACADGLLTKPFSNKALIEIIRAHASDGEGHDGHAHAGRHGGGHDGHAHDDDRANSFREIQE